MSPWPARPKPANVLLALARDGHLRCTRDKDLNPTFTANARISDADHHAILRYVLDGLLRYEMHGPYGFGIGRLYLTARGAAVLRDLPRGVKLVDR